MKKKKNHALDVAHKELRRRTRASPKLEVTELPVFL